jgi:hypothetical protein
MLNLLVWTLGRRRSCDRRAKDFTPLQPKLADGLEISWRLLRAAAV